MKQYLKNFFLYQDVLLWFDDMTDLDSRIEKWFKTKKAKIDFNKIYSDFIKYRLSLGDENHTIQDFIYFLENNDKSPFYVKNNI